MAGRAERTPGDVEPAGAGEELVGEVLGAKEVDQVLGVLDATNQSVDARVTEAGVDDDGAADSLTGRL